MQIIDVIPLLPQKAQSGTPGGGGGSGGGSTFYILGF